MLIVSPRRTRFFIVEFAKRLREEGHGTSFEAAMSGDGSGSADPG